MGLFKSREEKQAIADGRAALSGAGERLGTAPASGVVALARQIAEQGGALGTAECTKLIDDAFAMYLSYLVKDDILDESEEQLISEVGEALDVPEGWLAARPRMLAQVYIAKLNGGRFSVLKEPHVICKAGEQVYLESNVALMGEVARREWQGSSSGFSVPVGHGVRYRTGQMRGHLATVGSDMVEKDLGTLAVTSQRVAYLGGRKSMDIPLAKIIGLQVFTDGLRINASNRQNALLFKADDRSDTIAATITAAMQRPNE
jgi:hypothetical protein